MISVSLLGTSQITSRKEMFTCLQRLGLTPIFYEQEHLGENSNQSIPIYPIAKDFPPIPFFIFSEFWLTQLIRHKDHGITFTNQISDKALRASRSKLFFSDLLEKNNIPCVHRVKITKAPCDILKPGIIVRPDCAYSGKGVKYIACNVSYSQYLKDVSSELSGTVKSVMGERNIQFIEEEFLNGDEYSCDVIISPYGRKVIRVCYKKVKWISGYPCAMAYVTIPFSLQMESAILSWCDVLFEQEQDLSFAQFDFIKTNDGLYRPIDFSARPGGGLNFLLSCSLPGHNLYADSVCFAMGKTKSICNPQPNWAQFSMIADHAGKLKDISINWPYECKTMQNYNIGDKIKKTTLSSVSARVVSIISHVDSLADFSCLADNIQKYIKISYD